MTLPKPAKSQQMGLMSGTVVGLQGGKTVPRSVRANARAQGVFTFDVGDAAVLIHTYRSKAYKVLVTVIDFSWSGLVMQVGGKRNPVDTIIYKVRSEHGGTLSVRAQDLRPGNALDRIAAALADD